MENKKITKKIVSFLCFTGFLATVMFVPFVYLAKTALGNDKIIISKTKNDSGRKVFENINIKAAAAVIYDPSTGEFIYSKNGNSQLTLASITKVMSSVSAIRIAERMDKEKEVKFAGSWWNLFDLVKYALVSSSNGGVTSIAEAMSVTENKTIGKNENIDFIKEMNDTAKEIGLKTTYFLNETGLDINEDFGGAHIGGAYGSAKDVAKLFAYATKKYPSVFSATKYPEIKIKAKDGKEITSKNTNLDVSKMTTIIASKTGTTDLAGGNLVISFDAGLSHPVIISILGSTQEDRFKDAETLAKATIDFLSK